MNVLTTCSSSVLELSSGIVSGNTVSFGEETQLPLKIKIKFTSIIIPKNFTSLL